MAHKCIYPGCVAEGRNQIGVRLRKYPGPDNVWTQDTGAWVCDHHARQGMSLDIRVGMIGELKLNVHVSHEGSEPIQRITDIDPAKLPPPAQ